MSGLVRSITLLSMDAGSRSAGEHLDLIERQIKRRATRMALTAHIKDRSFGRSVPPWTPRDERCLWENLDRLRFERRDELDALSQVCTAGNRCPRLSG